MSFNNLSFSVNKLQLRHRSIIYYTQQEYTNSYSKNLFRIEQMKKVRNKQYSGDLTFCSKKRLKKTIDLMLQASSSTTIKNPVTGITQKFNVNFITLTVSDNTKNYTAKQCYDLCLKPFLQWLQKTMHVSMYIWKSELQKRGQIHYHIITNQFIHYLHIRNKWNYLQRKARMLDGYFKSNKHYNANSTDVHAVYNMGDNLAYLLKYMSKTDSVEVEKRGKVWDCSKNLKGQKFFTVDFDKEHELRLLRTADKYNLQEIDCDHCVIFKTKFNYYKTLLDDNERLEYQTFLERIARGDEPNLFSENDKIIEIKNEKIKLDTGPEYYKPKIINPQIELIFE